MNSRTTAIFKLPVRTLTVLLSGSSDQGIPQSDAVIAIHAGRAQVPERAQRCVADRARQSQLAQRAEPLVALIELPASGCIV